MMRVQAVGLAWPVSPDAVRRAHDQGLRVMAYILNDPAAIRDAIRAEVDVVITDGAANAGFFFEGRGCRQLGRSSL